MFWMIYQVGKTKAVKFLHRKAIGRFLLYMNLAVVRVRGAKQASSHSHSPLGATAWSKWKTSWWQTSRRFRGNLFHEHFSLRDRSTYNYCQCDSYNAVFDLSELQNVVVAPSCCMDAFLQLREYRLS